MSDDPFAGSEKAPAISFKEANVGDVLTVKVLEAANKVQGREYGGTEPLFWNPNKAAKQKKITDEFTNGKRNNEVWNAVINVEHEGERKSIWAQIPSAMFNALKTAQQEAGAQFAEGGILHIKFDGTKPMENKALADQKLYSAKYVPPKAKPEPKDDPWATTSTSQDSAPPF